jgi:hypothetical protein
MRRFFDRPTKEATVVSIVALWLPILLAAVLVFVASSIMHVVLRYHRKDFLPFPNEDAVRAALGSLQPGQYAVPCPADPKQKDDPVVARKYEEGPVALVTILPRGRVRMGPKLVQWFLFSVGIGVFVAYLCGRTLGAGTPYLQVFRFAGTIAWLGYGGALVWAGIWKGVPWPKVSVDVADALVYALVTAGAFAALWPR